MIKINITLLYKMIIMISKKIIEIKIKKLTLNNKNTLKQYNSSNIKMNYNTIKKQIIVTLYL